MEDYTKDVEVVSSNGNTSQPVQRFEMLQFLGRLPGIVTLTNIVVSLLSLYLGGHAYYLYNTSAWKLKHLIIVNAVMSIVGLSSSIVSTLAVIKKFFRLLNFNYGEAIVNAILAFLFAILYGVESSRIDIEEFSDSWLSQSLWISCANYGLIMGAKLYQAMLVKLYIRNLTDNYTEPKEEAGSIPLAEADKIGSTTNMEATTHLESKSVESLV